MRIYPIFTLLLFGLLAVGCEPATEMQDIDLSDQVSDRNADGIGHYVYSLSLPRRVAAGETLEVQMEWRTRGPVEPTALYDLDVLLSGPATHRKVFRAQENNVGEIHPDNWFNYRIPLPETLPAGDYTLSVRVRDTKLNDRVLELGYREALLAGDGYYRLAELEVVN